MASGANEYNDNGGRPERGAIQTLSSSEDRRSVMMLPKARSRRRLSIVLSADTVVRWHREWLRGPAACATFSPITLPRWPRSNY